MALDALDLGVAAGQSVSRILVVVEQQRLALPRIERMASDAGPVQFSPVRIGVTSGAVGFEAAEKSAPQGRARRPRLVALDALGPGVAARERIFRISIVIE